ncbi:3-hydroxyisobutyryl-CoA hydrolase [Coemansia sp. RSA 1365]|nr:3-hydroxyisobutyryl-CoA hydrolase [Coemansia sp. RSA 1365]
MDDAKPTMLSRLDGIRRMIQTEQNTEGNRQVLTVSNKTGRTLVLNRPEALNSLTLPMVQSIETQLQRWGKSALCNIVMLRSNSPKAFCAGGDVVSVVKAWKEGETAKAIKFFKDEYRMNHHIASYNKPIVAMLNGYTMGGGVGLSIHAPFRVANETTVFAMPETKIGLFPDVGASFFLPRMDGQTGVYLGMTGERLKGRDLLYAGIATHYVPSERYQMLEQRLQGLGTCDYDVVNQAIEEFVAQSEDEGIDYSLAGIRDAIDWCFQYNTVEEIVAALEQESLSNSEMHAEWAKKTLGQLSKMSPSSLKLTLELLRNGQKLNIKQALQLELRLMEKRLESHDMQEGIEALLVRKTDDAKWQPSTLEEIDMEALSAEYFDHPSNAIIEFTHRAAFTEYPHKFGLPTENDIGEVVRGNNPQAGAFRMSRDDVTQFFEKLYADKIGVRQKVLWTLNIKTKLGDGNYVEWII